MIDAGNVSTIDKQSGGAIRHTILITNSTDPLLLKVDYLGKAASTASSPLLFISSAPHCPNGWIVVVVMCIIIFAACILIKWYLFVTVIYDFYDRPRVYIALLVRIPMLLFGIYVGSIPYCLAQMLMLVMIMPNEATTTPTIIIIMAMNLVHFCMWVTDTRWRFCDNLVKPLLGCFIGVESIGYFLARLVMCIYMLLQEEEDKNKAWGLWCTRFSRMRERLGLCFRAYSG
jgi:hypothetical protein